MNALVAAALSGIVSLVVSAFFVTGTRLRATASSDAALLEQIREADPAAADALRRSLSRSLMLATARTIHPPAAPTEVLGIVGAIVGLPVFAAGVTGGTTTRIAVLIELALLLLVAYALSTASWRRRAQARAAELAAHPATKTYDAPECIRQTNVMLGLQTVALAISISVGSVIATHNAGWPQKVSLLVTLGGFLVTGVLTWARVPRLPVLAPAESGADVAGHD